MLRGSSSDRWLSLTVASSAHLLSCRPILCTLIYLPRLFKRPSSSTPPPYRVGVVAGMMITPPPPHSTCIDSRC